MIRWLRGVGIFSTVLFAVGCSNSKYHPVDGRLVYPDGTPVKGLDGGQVLFRSKSANDPKVTATGAIDAEGCFRLGTETLADGALPGKHEVAITPGLPGADLKAKPAIDKHYGKFETSGLEAEVTPGSPQVTITVEPPKQK
jgi:hypothetical protein